MPTTLTERKSVFHSSLGLILDDDKSSDDDKSVQNIARGQTLIALRRLDHGDESKDEKANESKDEKANESKDEKANESKVEMGVPNGLLTALKHLNPLKTDDTSKDDTSKDDTGKLKGLLIRYLYDANLIGYKQWNGKIKAEPGVINLASANITNVVLENAWLLRIDLSDAMLNKGNFKNAALRFADLSNANLTGADLSNANLLFADLSNAPLTGADLSNADLIYADLSNADLSNADLSNADLRFAEFKEAKNLSKATLKGACYVEGTESTNFPSGFDPKKFGMVPISKKDSPPSDTAKFKRCESVPLGSNP